MEDEQTADGLDPAADPMVAGDPPGAEDLSPLSDAPAPVDDEPRPPDATPEGQPAEMPSVVEATPVLESESGETAAEAPPAEQQPPPSRQEERPRQRPDAQQREIDRVMRSFHACGRCSTFVAACGVYLGRETVREAAARTQDGWLTLECDTGARRLIDNAYGVSADLLAYYLDSTCPECRRRYLFIDRTAEEQPCLLQLAI